MKFKVAGIIFSFLLVFGAACKKNNGNGTPANKAILSVKLNQLYLGAERVDSAFAIWKTNGQEQRIRMQIRNDSLITEMSAFDEGTGELTLYIFSNKKYNNQYYGQWVSRKAISLQKNAAISYAGPTSFYDADWFPRIELADAIGHKAIIALRPDDAYFVVKDPGHAIIKLTMERMYWNTTGGVQLAGGAVWECYTGCFDVVNDEYFKMLPSRIGDRPWNHVSITIVFAVDPVSGGWILSLEYEP